MESVDRALKALKEAEALRAQAITDLLRQRDDIDKKLRELGHTGKAKVRKPCSTCGSTEHDGRAHRAKAASRDGLG